MSSLVTRVLLVEAGVLALTYATLLAIAAWRVSARRRREPDVQSFRAALRRLLGGRDLSPMQLRAAERLPARVRARLIAEIAESVRGDGRARLAQLACELGVRADAERACASRHWWRRVEGIRLLTLAGVHSDAVAPLMADSNDEVRAAAALWAGDQPDRDIIHTLVAMLDDDAALCRFAAKSALLRIGPAATEIVAERLDRSDCGRVEDVLDVAVGLGDMRLLAPALRAADEGGPGRRVRAADLAGAVGGELAIDALDRMLLDEDDAVRAAAAEAAGALRHWPFAPRLWVALGDRSWEVRRAAGLSLRALGAPGALLLRDALDHGDPFARDMARQVLDRPDAVRARA